MILEGLEMSKMWLRVWINEFKMDFFGLNEKNHLFATFTTR